MIEGEDVYLFNTERGRFFCVGYGISRHPGCRGATNADDAEKVSIFAAEALLDDTTEVNDVGIASSPWMILKDDELDTIVPKPLTAEELTESERGVVIGMGETPREWLEFIRDNEIRTKDQIINALLGWMAIDDLGKCLRANEMSPDFMLDNETVDEMLEDQR
jgi:hypothetical protein